MRLLLLLLGMTASALVGAETLAIVNAEAYTMGPAGRIDGATILIEQGRISAVGPALAVPDDAQLIDAGGRPVTPGLFNSATQLGLIEVSSAADTVDAEVGSGALGASFDVQYGLNANSTLIPLARADGLTRAVVVPGASAGAPFLGRGALLRLVEGPALLARPQLAMFAAVGGATSGEAGQSRAAQWSLLRNALDEAQHYAKHARAYRTAAARDQLLNRLDIEALLPVVDGRQPIAVFATRESDIRQALALADDYPLRLVLCGASEAWRVADLLAARQVPVVLDPFDNLPVRFDSIGARLDNAARLQAAGVLIAFYVGGGIHQSHNAGAALREAAGLAVANGLSRSDALAALTVNPARIWGVADQYGTLERGREADVVVWDGDPLEPMSTPERVLVGGRIVSLETRQSELRDRYRPAAAAERRSP